MRQSGPSLEGTWDYEWIETSLLGRARGTTSPPGLLGLLPHRFLPVVFGLLAGGAITSTHTEPKNEELEAAFAAWREEIRRSRPADEAEMEAQLRPFCQPPWSIAEATGELVLDTHAVNRPAPHVGRDELLVAALRAWLREALERGGSAIKNTYWPAAQTSRSMAARVLLLELLVEDSEARMHEIVDAMLMDHRIYHDSSTFYTWTAITVRWSAIDATRRSRVLDNIAHVARSPWVNGIYAVAPLLCAVPEVDRPAELRSFMRIYAIRGADPAPRRPSRRRTKAVVSRVSADDLFERVARVDLISPACLAPWRRLFLLRGQLHDTPEARKNALRDLEAIVDECLPDGEALLLNSWMLSCVADVVRATVGAGDTEDDAQPVGELTAGCTRRIVAWGFQVLEMVTPRVLGADGKPHTSGTASSPEERVWMDAISMVDWVLRHAAFAGDLELNQRLLDVVARTIPESAQTLASFALTQVSSFRWFLDAKHGPVLLRSLLDEKLRSGQAQSDSLHLLRGFSPQERDEVLSRWLLERREVPISDAASFAESIGVYLGQCFLVARTNRSYAGAGRLLERVLVEQPREGIFGERDAYLRFVKGTIIGAKEMVQQKASQPWSAEEYARLITACWGALRAVGIEEAESRNVDLSLFALHWLFETPRMPSDEAAIDRRAWWKVLEPLARRIVQEGCRVEVFHLMFQIRTPDAVRTLGAANLRGIVEALASGVEREPEEVLHARTDHMESWPMILKYGSELLENVALDDPDSADLQERIFTILHTWSRPPLAVARAQQASGRLRR